MKRQAMNRTGIWAAVAVFMSGPVGICLASPPQYTMTDLGTGAACGININGPVVGSSGSTGRAFLYTPGVGVQDLGTLPGGTSSYAFGINDNGQIVGFSYTGDGN